MGAIKHKVSHLARMLERERREVKRLVSVIESLQTYLEEEPKRIICRSLDHLARTILAEAARRTFGSAVVIISPEGGVIIGETYQEDWNRYSWLNRLKSEGFFIVTAREFTLLVESLKSEVSRGEWQRSVEFLRANKSNEESPASRVPASEIRKRPHDKVSQSSGWKISDFLPAPPPYPPLPRGLFKGR